MEAAIFILVSLVFGLVAYLTQISPWLTGFCILPALGGFIAWTVRLRDRALKPLRTDFDRLYQQFAARYGHMKTGKRFLEMVSKPIPRRNRLDQGMDDFMDAGSKVYDAVTDPGRMLMALVLAPVVAGIGSLIGKVWKDERTEEQKREETALFHARSAMDRQSDAFHHRILVSALVAVGTIVACALIPPPEFTPRMAVSESVAVAPLPTTAPVYLPPTPAVEASPAPVTSTPTPDPMAVAHQEPVATPAPSLAFATVAEAQKAAVERYPALSIGGSKLNAAFVARYKLYKQTRPAYFNDSAWPMNLAMEVSQTVR